MKRLNIVVPYRAREAHLNQFVPHVRAYFARDKIDREIPYSVLIIEQEEGLPFNRGALKNIGFKLGRDQGDYTCFHDVDYLPIWADYSWTESPSPIVWYGAEVSPIAPGRSNAVFTHDLEAFYGGALLVPNTDFERVNGYSNAYWGWGYEDQDLAYRFKAMNISINRRKGSFARLHHDNEGFQLDGTLTPIGVENEKLFKMKWGPQLPFDDDGLSNLGFEILRRRNMPEETVVERPASWEIVTVRINMQPRQEQLDAIKKSRPQISQPSIWNLAASMSSK
jgi:hypothetical protein